MKRLFMGEAYRPYRLRYKAVPFYPYHLFVLGAKGTDDRVEKWSLLSLEKKTDLYSEGSFCVAILLYEFFFAAFAGMYCNFS
ncbi:MAG: hypothetical protein LBJ00_02200 [Planctomycetaceae bacterium]|nr:hypothetical protein [Planctomycetaceae bacterium]